MNNKNNNSLGIQCTSSSLTEQFLNTKGVFRHGMRRESNYQEIKGSRLTKTKKLMKKIKDRGVSTSSAPVYFQEQPPFFYKNIILKFGFRLFQLGLFLLFILKYFLCSAGLQLLVAQFWALLRNRKKIPITLKVIHCSMILHS